MHVEILRSTQYTVRRQVVHVELKFVHHIGWYVMEGDGVVAAQALQRNVQRSARINVLYFVKITG